MSRWDYLWTSLEPVYQRSLALREYTESLALAFTNWVRPEHSQEAVPEFRHVRRVWHHKDDPAYAYAYFRLPDSGSKEWQERFEEQVSALAHKAFDSGGPKPELSSYINWVVDRQGHLRAVETAGKWLRDQTSDSVKYQLPRFHHHLLMLYSRTPVTGGIPGTLTGMLSATKGQAFLVTTKPEGSNDAPDLPKLDVLRFPEVTNFVGVNQEPVVAPAKGSTEQTRFFLNVLDPWFREGIVSDPNPEDGTLDRSGITMLWIPIFDFHHKDEVAGWFQGWIFQVLPNDRGVLLQKYVKTCRQPLGLLASRLADQALREAMNQPLAKDGKPLSSVKQTIHLLGGWRENDPTQTLNPGTTFEYDSDSSTLTIWLRQTEFDEGSSASTPTRTTSPSVTHLVLSHTGDEFLAPEEASEAECFGRLAARIRDLFREFELDHERLRAAEVDLQRSAVHSLKNHLVGLVVAQEAINKKLANKSNKLQLLGLHQETLYFLLEVQLRQRQAAVSLLQGGRVVGNPHNKKPMRVFVNNLIAYLWLHSLCCTGRLAHAIELLPRSHHLDLITLVKTLHEGAKLVENFFYDDRFESFESGTILCRDQIDKTNSFFDILKNMGKSYCIIDLTQNDPDFALEFNSKGEIAFLYGGFFELIHNAVSYGRRLTIRTRNTSIFFQTELQSVNCEDGNADCPDASSQENEGLGHQIAVTNLNSLGFRLTSKLKSKMCYCSTIELTQEDLRSAGP